MEKILNYIGGELLEPINGKYLNNFNPATGEVYSLIPDSDDADVELAVTSAKNAFPMWSGLTPEKRSRYLLKIAELIDKNLQSLATAETTDNGKPFWLSSTVDIPRASANFRFYATAILHDHEEAYKTTNDIFNYTQRVPLGVAGCISPWNLPLYLFTWKIAPALASGNCVVAKPSEVTPYTSYLLSKLCKEAGLPNGVLNIVHGTGPKAGNAIITHKDIPAISFTGGTKTGEHIAKTVAPMFKKLSLELGGKNPNIIFADCDFDAMMKTTINSSFSNQGQICLCGSRIFVEKSIYTKFKDEFVNQVKNLIVGDPLKETSRMGAVVSHPHMEKVLSYIKLAQEEGGTILCGGNQVKLPGRCENGYFLQPTVIEGLPYTCRTNQEEIFGPVVTLTPFETEAEVLEMANSTQYGLSATIWTNNIGKANRIAQKVNSGIIWINCWLIRDLRTPFGGMKNSGIGREGGFESLHFFTEQKNICVKIL